MKPCIVVPFHNPKDLFITKQVENAKDLGLPLIAVIDSGNLEPGLFEHFIDLRHTYPTGIVKPSLYAVNLAKELGYSHIIRITQDSYFHNLKDFVGILKDMTFMGRKCRCTDLVKHLKMLRYPRVPRTIDYVQGNIMIASVNFWTNEYVETAKMFNHIAEDSMFSYLVSLNHQIEYVDLKYTNLNKG
jgi:hypothetical protein